MSLINKPFIDSRGLRGRAIKAPSKSIEVKGKLARSYDKNISFEGKTFSVRLLADGYYHIDFSNLVGNRIKINKTTAKLLAEFILDSR